MGRLLGPAGGRGRGRGRKKGLFGDVWGGARDGAGGGLMAGDRESGVEEEEGLEFGYCFDVSGVYGR